MCEKKHNKRGGIVFSPLFSDQIVFATYNCTISRPGTKLLQDAADVVLCGFCILCHEFYIIVGKLFFSDVIHFENVFAIDRLRSSRLMSRAFTWPGFSGMIMFLPGICSSGFLFGLRCPAVRAKESCAVTCFPPLCTPFPE